MNKCITQFQISIGLRWTENCSAGNLLLVHVCRGEVDCSWLELTKDPYENMNREKIMWIILLIGLTSFVCEMFVTKKSLTSYQTEQEDGSFWWDTKTNTNLSLMDLDCLFLSDPPKVLYQMINGVEYPESQSEQFAGRVQLDRDALRDGQIRLHLSTVTAEDSGNYQCDLAFNYDKNTGTWSLLDTETFVLTVSRTIDGDDSEVSLDTLKSGPEMPEGSEQRRGNQYVFLALFVLGLLATVMVALRKIPHCCQEPAKKGQKKEEVNALIGQRNEVKVAIPDT
ncbi:hypothetical protein Q5P01_002791 [Channa striata]|uniref:Immunoglobulin V-set domain-containing protein n=1 Tax=Channa striata TaxID=64152 RepID=A0AA88P1H6_CHASR|nr:hypothetical protein Q5P01_002791 [Channa striata]